MKHMRKLVALFAALALVLAMAVPAFAAADTTYTVTVKNPVGKYEAYQIFTGRLENGVLSDVEWGTGITEAGKNALGNAAERAAALSGKGNDGAEVKAFAKEVAQYLSTTYKESEAYADGATSTTIKDLSAGYYLIKNEDNSVSDDSFYTDFIMQVVENTSVSPKGDKPTLDKQIKHNESQAWGVVGDNQIGDTVEFRTITTVPNVSGYTKYDYVIKDTMSAGLTSNVEDATDITIKVKDNDVLDSSYYTVTASGNSFEVKIDILKAIADGKMQSGDSLYTYYTGVLNENAKIYNDKQDNTAHLEYSNNPNDDSSRGNTPDKKVYDWTYQMEVNKIDGATKKDLTGAKFVLSKKNITLGDINENGVPTETSDLIKLIENNDGSYTIAPDDYTGPTAVVITAGKITIKGLDDDTTYYLYETKAPEGYNRIDTPTTIRISASYNGDGSVADAPKVSVNGGESTTDMKVEIVNNAGTTLPSTGGIGTTIFYVVGGGLMAAAAVLLITKKRMENK